MIDKSQIKELRKTTNQLLISRSGIFEQYLDKFRIENVYHSAKIHGCGLTLSETRDYLLNGNMGKEKDLLDYIISENIYDAINWFENKTNNNYPIDVKFLSEFNKRMLKGISKHFITINEKKVSRKINSGILQDEIPRQPFESNINKPIESSKSIRNQIEKLLLDIHYSNDISLERVSSLFYTFLNIQPFEIGNGRMSRILVNSILKKGNFPYITFKCEDTEYFTNALQEANIGNLAEMSELILNKVIESYHDMISYFSNSSK
jgi:Fic family protein